jgi:hypothetical protein
MKLEVTSKRPLWRELYRKEIWMMTQQWSESGITVEEQNRK